MLAGSVGTCELEHLQASWPFTPRPCSPGCRIQSGHTTQLETQQGWCSEQPLSNWVAEIKSSLRKLTGCNCVCVALVVHLLSCVPLFHDSMDCSPLLSTLFCPWNSPGKDTGVGCHSLLQGTFPTQGSNPDLLHWQADSLPLSYQGSPETKSHLNVLSEFEKALSWPISS